MKTIIYVFLLYSCIGFSYINKGVHHPNEKQERKKCLRQLEQDVKHYWRYNPETGFYKADTPFYKKLNDGHYLYQCVVGQDTTYVFNLFGKEHTVFYIPHENTHNDSGWAALEYPVIKTRDQQESLRIIFSKKFHVTKIYYAIAHSSIDY